MEVILDEVVPLEEFEKFETEYNQEETGGQVSHQTQFNYAFCLIRSKHREDIQRGIILLEDLCYRGDPNAKRDYLYYIAFANTRLQDYERAHDCIKRFLEVEPTNSQAIELEALIRDRLTKEGVAGLAIMGGVAVVASLLAGIGFSLVKNILFK